MPDEPRTIKRGDLWPPYAHTLLDGAGNPIDLTTATAVHLTVVNRETGETQVHAEAEIVDADAGEVQYAWVEGDTDTSGIYRTSWEITWTGGKPQTVPDVGYDVLIIESNLVGV